MVSRRAERVACAVALILAAPGAGCGDDAGGRGEGGGSGGGASGASLLASVGSGNGPATGQGSGAGTGQGPAQGSGPGSGDATGSGPTSSGQGAGAPCGGESDHTGEATYYDADGTGNCSFDASPDYVAALNDPDYDVAAWCGACAAVDGPDGSVVVRIVDRCPECPTGNLDLSPNAFEAIAPLEAGRVPITWRWVSCDVAGPIAYRFKEGSNPYWSAIQVRNHRFAIASLEAVDPASGEYVQLVRQDYNYFLWETGLGEGPYTLRTTDVYGHVLVDEGVAFIEAGTRDGAAQLPTCE